MTGSGVATVARQEFRLRIRAGRWKLLLGAWVLVLTALTVLLRLAAGTVESVTDKGIPVFGGLVLVVLGLSLLVVPSLAAHSVNGDRERGTLAALQVTRLTPGDIVMGKFAAAWGTAMLFLALVVPLALYAVTQGGVPVGRLLAVLLLIGLLLGVVCAVSLCLSAVLGRTTASGLAAYLVVGVLTIGTLLAFGLATALTQEEYQSSSLGLTCESEAVHQEHDGPGPPEGCTEEVYTYPSSRTRTDRVWFLLAPNPFVVVSDAAPALPDPHLPGLTQEESERRLRAADLDPLGQIGRGVRDLRREPLPIEVLQAQELRGTYLEPEQRATGPVWPYGLAVDLAVAALALLVATRRLRTPSRTLPRGQRVA